MTRWPLFPMTLGLAAMLAGACQPADQGVRQKPATTPDKREGAASDPAPSVAVERDPTSAETSPPDASASTNRRLLLEELQRQQGTPRARPQRTGPARAPKRPTGTWARFKDAFDRADDAEIVAEWTGDSRLVIDTKNVQRLTLDLHKLPAGAPRRGPWNVQIDDQGIEITGFRGKILDLVRSKNGAWAVDRKSIRK